MPNTRIIAITLTKYIFRIPKLTHFFTHIIHALIWATSIYFIPETSIDFNKFGDAVYFSLVTFTSLGYGDLTISSPWRMLSGIEAINGIMLIGWSTALMYSLIQKLFSSLNFRSK
ncbi:MAG: potassium channel family protein [Draconibacterium sp.]